MKSTARRLTAYLFVLLHVVVVGGAPIADAALERGAAAASMRVADLRDSSGEQSQRGGPVHLHDGCIFCAVISAAADQPWGLVLDISTRTVDVRESSLTPLPVPRPAVTIARTRAPPALSSPSAQALVA